MSEQLTPKTLYTRLRDASAGGSKTISSREYDGLIDCIDAWEADRQRLEAMERALEKRLRQEYMDEDHRLGGTGRSFEAFKRATLGEEQKMSDLHRTLSTVHPSLERGQVWCRKCGHTEKVKSATALEFGCPKHCGATMTIDSPEEQRLLAAQRDERGE